MLILQIRIISNLSRPNYLKTQLWMEIIQCWKNAAITVPLKYLSDFWGSVEMSLIYYKVALKLTWKKHCVLAGVGNDVADSGNIICIVKDTKLYVPVVILSAKDNQKLAKTS